MPELDVTAGDPLAGWDPRRRAALEQLWACFAAAGDDAADLGEQLIAERRREAAADAPE